MFRLLTVSVRGHKYLVGNPNVHPVDTLPADRGSRFHDIDHVKRYVKRELGGISSICAVEVIATDSAKVALRGTRAGRGGTGNTWLWDKRS